MRTGQILKRGSQEIVDSVAEGSQQTPLAWLAGPTERVIAVLGHTSTRMLVLLAVARQRWWLFWCGFTLFAVVDGIAGYVHVAGLVSTISMWWVELALVPVAIISVPIILTCYRRWPETTSSDT